MLRINSSDGIPNYVPEKLVEAFPYNFTGRSLVVPLRRGSEFDATRCFLKKMVRWELDKREGLARSYGGQPLLRANGMIQRLEVLRVSGNRVKERCAFQAVLRDERPNVHKQVKHRDLDILPEQRMRQERCGRFELLYGVLSLQRGQDLFPINDLLQN